MTLLTALSQCNAEESNAEELKVVDIVGTVSFYKTAPGTLAYLPHINKAKNVVKAAIYTVFPESGAYKLKRKQRYCFVINHITERSESQSYLGVAIVPYMSHEHAEPTSIFYSTNWIRNGDSEYNNRNGIIDVLPIPVMDFFKLHGSNNDYNLTKFDKELGQKWHGTIKGTKLNSWTKKSLWDLSSKLEKKEFLSNFSSKVEKNNYKRIDALLISFSPTDSYNTQKPVKFCFSGDRRKAVYLKTFAEHSPEFEREYYFTFK